ncbi:MAG: TolC family protein [bacterium]|nr:TolC family protein [bacterium]
METFLKLWTILLIAAPAAAQQHLSLEQARRSARDQSFRIRAAGHMVEAAAAEVRSAKAELLPSLSAVATFVDYDGDVFYSRFINPLQPGVPNPMATPTDVGEFSSTNAGLLKLSQPLYTGGAAKAKVRASDVERRIAEQELRQQQIDLDYQVTKAYYDVLLTDRAAQVAGQSVRRSEETLETVRQRQEEEEALKVEELAAESRLAADNLHLLQAESDARFARLALDRLMAREAGGELQLSDPLEAPRREIGEEAAASRALESHPALKRGELRVALAEQASAAARAHFRPKLELEGYYSRIDSETLFEGTTFGFDLKISIPFLRDAAAGGGAAARAAASRDMEEARRREASSRIRLLARQNARRAIEAYGAVEVARRALDYQREKYRITASAFREQLATTEDVMTEQAALGRAELEVHAALHQARLAEAELDRVAPPASH